MAVKALVGGDSGKLASSEDGVTWTLRTSTFGTSRISAIAYSPELGQWLLGGQALAESSDGETFSAVTNPASGAIQGLAWSADLAIWVMSTVGGGIFTSPDGTTWTSRTSGTTDNLLKTTWIPDLGKFYIGSIDGNVYESTDGINWAVNTALAAASASAINIVVYSPTLGVGQGLLLAAVNTEIYYSDDAGASWNFDAAWPSETVGDMVWSSPAGLFVGPSTSGPYSSPDAVTWTNTDTGAGTANGLAITWQPELGLFIDGGSAGQIQTSPDGLNWTVRSSGFGSTAIRAVSKFPGDYDPSPPVIRRPVVGFIGFR